MLTIIKYIGAGLMALLVIGLVEKFMPNLEVTEELTLFMFVSLYLNILNLVNYGDLKTTVKVNHILDVQIMKEVCGEERCKKAAEKIHKEYLEAIEKDA